MKKIICLLFLLSTIAHGSKLAPCNIHSAKGDSCEVDILSLHPTQMCLGMRAVDNKASKLSEKSASDLDDYQQNHPEPIVIGPSGVLYITDHHHLARALYDIGVRTTYGTIVENLSNLSEANFWAEMSKNNWLYLYDNGKGPLSHSELPSTVLEMHDDPFRSLAEVVRDAGGYDKTTVLYADFLWADFFRARVSLGNDDASFNKAAKKAMALAHSQAAADLPGYNSK